MSKHAAIIHGTGGSADSFWHPWLKVELEKKGYSVWTPSIPNSTDGLMNEWQDYLVTAAPQKNFDLVIGHSSGVPLLLSLLSHQHISARHMIGIAGFVKPLTGTKEENLDFLERLDASNIKSSCQSFTFIHSDNDPWGCDIAQGEYMSESLGGELVIKQDQGHFGSDKFNQPYKEFPDLLDLCLFF
jgi:predicted alpha/beta hydrolase family esterase